MALQKEITLSNGAVGNYLKIDAYAVNRRELNLTVRLALFKDAAYKDGLAISPGKEYSFTCTKEELNGDVVALGYAKIKAKNDPELDGAIDA